MEFVYRKVLFILASCSIFPPILVEEHNLDRSVMSYVHIGVSQGIWSSVDCLLF